MADAGFPTGSEGLIPATAGAPRPGAAAAGLVKRPAAAIIAGVPQELPATWQRARAAFERAVAAERKAIEMHERAARTHDAAARRLAAIADLHGDRPRAQELDRRATQERLHAEAERQHAAAARAHLADDNASPAAAAARGS